MMGLTIKGLAHARWRGCRRFIVSANCLVLLVLAVWVTAHDFAAAHHVLGRPSYSLNEDSNTPPSMQGEAWLGDYFITYMAFPAFPRPKSPGRINLYVKRIKDAAPFEGEVTFSARRESWLSSWFFWLGFAGKAERLGVQQPDDAVFRQGFVFHEAGNHMIIAEFEAGGEPHTIEFPVRIGDPTPVGPIGISVGVLLIVLLGVSLVQRRRAMTGKIRGATTS